MEQESSLLFGIASRLPAGSPRHLMRPVLRPKRRGSGYTSSSRKPIKTRLRRAFDAWLRATGEGLIRNHRLSPVLSLLPGFTVGAHFREKRPRGSVLMRDVMPPPALMVPEWRCADRFCFEPVCPGCAGRAVAGDHLPVATRIQSRAMDLRCTG